RKYQWARMRGNLKLRLQATYEIGHADLTFQLEPLRRQNGAQFGKGVALVAIDDDVIVFRPMAHFVTGFGHARSDHRLAVLRPALEPAFQLFRRRRQDEDADKIGRGCPAELLRALPIDIEQHIAAGLQSLEHRRSRRAVAVAEHFRPFEQLAMFYHFIKARWIDEMVVTAVAFATAFR